jgi:hypothetical protein
VPADPRKLDPTRPLPCLARPLDGRYTADRDGRQRWVAFPVHRWELDDPAALLGRLWPQALRKADALGSIPTGEPPEVLSHAEMMGRDPGAALWRPGSWWFVLNIREQRPGDVEEVVVRLEDDGDDERGLA